MRQNPTTICEGVANRVVNALRLTGAGLLAIRSRSRPGLGVKRWATLAFPGHRIRLDPTKRLRQALLRLSEDKKSPAFVLALSVWSEAQAARNAQ